VIPAVTLGLPSVSITYLLTAIETRAYLDIILGILYLIGSFLMIYLTIKFGFSLLKSSINKFKGIKGPTMLEIIKKERLSKIKT